MGLQKSPPRLATMMEGQKDIYAARRTVKKAPGQGADTKQQNEEC